MNPTSPVPLGLAPSFGFGDRLGDATTGHLAALRAGGGPIRGVFAQQSIREMARTRREPAAVMADATRVLDAAGFDEPWGADADHLKTNADVDATLAAGFTFFTIDPSDHVDPDADGCPAGELEGRPMGSAAGWIDGYVGREEDLGGGVVVRFDREAVLRAAVKYGRAIDHALALGAHLGEAAGAAGREHEVEISVDETDQPTTLVEHWIFADRLLRAGLPLVSLAPRFVGDLEKGVDYLGPLGAFEASLAGHAAIARALGPYKLSLHSGSDKLSIYESFARITGGLFHVKTAGTSYLEAVRVAAREDETLFRDVVTLARARYDEDRATYHVHAEASDAPDPADASVGELIDACLQRWKTVPEGTGFTAAGRQVLHCTFGSVVTDPGLGPRLRACLTKHPDTHRDILVEHFGRHLAALRRGLDAA